jgi:hypothetical protein
MLFSLLPKSKAGSFILANESVNRCLLFICISMIWSCILFVYKFMIWFPSTFGSLDGKSGSRPKMIQRGS